jgi:arabinofuranosyltransferase
MLAFFWLAIRVKITNHTHWSLISIAIATALLNRMDVAVLFIPFCAYWGILALRNHCPLKCWTAALIGATPLIGWLLFSLFYYGFLLPNTYYAKLHTGISPLDYIWQSHYAFMDLLHNHANTAFFLILGAGLTLFACIKHIKNRTLLTHTTPLELLSLGAILYCLYFASIGGDHYSGRFFTLPALIFTLLIVEKCKRLYSNPIGKLCCILAVLSLVYAAEQLQSPKSMQPGKIEDARKMSERTLTLWNLNPQKHSWVKQGVAMHQASNMHLMQGRKEHPVVVRSNAGLAPFYAGPQVIIVDFLGITDPLIARTSVRNTTRGKWHSGHFWRAVPKGYVLARKGKGTQKMHSALAEYYQHLHTITSAPLFSTERLKTILNMQLGRYDHLLKEYEISLPWKK